MDYIFELRVPVACTVSFGFNREIGIKCFPSDLLRFHVSDDHDFSTVLQIHDFMPIDKMLKEGKEV